jgi:uncharacterized protein (DUF1499 family)
LKLTTFEFEHMIKTVLIFFLSLPVLLLAAGQLGFLQGQRPTDLGVREGRLKPPSNTNNSVSSQAGLYPDNPQKKAAFLAPLPLKNGSAESSIQALTKILRGMAGIRVVEQHPDYLYAQAQTRWLKFVDDIEFWINPSTQVIEIRSASRLGREDLGANRQRIETIRAAYLER